LHLKEEKHKAAMLVKYNRASIQILEFQSAATDMGQKYHKQWYGEFCEES
jgi:hypothetical protein